MIDYKPRREKAIAAAEAALVKTERFAFTQPVQANRGTVYRVDLAGTTVEWTDRFSSANDAYQKSDTLPKVLMSMSPTGSVGIVKQQLI